MPSIPLSSSENRRIWLGALLLATLVILAYRGSLRVPFVFDDVPTIIENPTIRQLWPLTNSLIPPPNSGVTTAGRPLVNLSLAINHAIGGLQVQGYHIFNILLHICAGLTLFGLIRRTLLQPKMRDHFGQASLPLALAIAVLWSLHPLGTECVTYIVQRAELMAALFCLLSLYCFIRGTSSDRKGWLGLSVVACFLGVASKEVGAMAPLLIFLYDRTFVAEEFRKAWQLRWKYYLALASSWILQVLLILSTGNRGGTTGFAEWMPWWKYTLTQSWAICNYLKLSFWPDPLIFDYGTELITAPAEIAMPMLFMALLLGLTIYALIRKPLWGFAGAWFFIILAPSSSFLPVITQTIAEHRMYLPLTMVVTLVVLGIYRWLGKYSGLVFIVLALGACILTQMRNEDYQSPISIWKDSLAKQPENARAWKTLGVLIAAQGNYATALEFYDRATALEPRDAIIQFNAGNALSKLGRYPEAAGRYLLATKIRPGYYQAHNNLGNILLEGHHVDEAIQEFQEAARINPKYADAHFNWGRALLIQGKREEALVQLRAALQINPDFQIARNAIKALE